ncbi:BrnT family toxin [bacterium]|nr:MAG: BrnT family toxin [bacterium]
MDFEWDEQKAARNLKIHGVSFETAKEVFQDPYAITVTDEAHSWDEEREFTLGLVQDELVVAVSHTDREGRIRIISARPATARERSTYEN